MMIKDEMLSIFFCFVFVELERCTIKSLEPSVLLFGFKYQVFAKMESSQAKQKHIFVLSHHLGREAFKRHVTIYDVLIYTNNIQM